MVDAEGFPDLVDRQADVAGGERGVAGIHARGGQLNRVGGAIQVEPGAGGGVVLVIFDAVKGDGLRAAEAVVHDHVGGDGAGRHVVHGDGLRGDGVGGEHRGDDAGGDVAVGGQGGVVDLDGLTRVDERRAAGDGHGEGAARDVADGAEHAVAGGLHQLVEESTELLHAVGHFALGGVFDGALTAGGGVLHELGDFNGEAEENRGDLRDVIGGAAAAPEVAAVGVVAAGFASGVDL